MYIIARQPRSTGSQVRDGARQHLRGVGDVFAPRPRVSGEGAGDGSLAGGLVRVDENFLAVAAQPDSPGLGLAHDFVEGARARERAPPDVHVRGRVGDVHGFVASGDAGKDVDLAANFRADEAGSQADAPLIVAGEGHLREKPTGVCTPVRTDEDALVGASPRQAHDIDAAAHRPRARTRGQADVSRQNDARDAVFRQGGRGQRAGRVDEEAARFDVDACAVAADVEDAVGLACGFVAWPGGPRVDADAGEGFLLINVLGRQVGDARTRVDGRSGDGVDSVAQALLAWCREHEGGSDSRVLQTCTGGVPVKVEQGRVSEDPRERVDVRGPGEFVDNGRVGVGQAQRRESWTGHEARIGRADSGSREVAVAVVVVVDHSLAEGVVSCARIVVGAVGAFCGESPFEGFAHRFGQQRPSDGVHCCNGVPIKCGDAWRHPVARGEEAELLVSEASWGGGVRAGWVWVCCEESASGASEGLGAGRFSQGRGRGRCRHCLPFHSTSLRLLSKCEALWRSDTPPMAAISGTASAPQAFRGDASSRNEKSGNLASCLLVGGVLFGHWRSGTTFPLATGGTTRRAVRKHRAPNGALRLVGPRTGVRGVNVSESTERQ